MHRCLQLPDVFNLILEYALVEMRDDDPYAGQNSIYRSTNPTLAALARTCRAFLEPTLDVLWRSQETLGPLVLTLPADALKQVVRQREEPDGVLYEVTIIRPLFPSEWARFDYYAHKIKYLGYYMAEYEDTEQTHWAIHLEIPCHRPVYDRVVRQLCVHRRQLYLLPNLTHIRWRIFEVSYINCLPMFLGTKLTTLSIAFYQSSAEDYSGMPNYMHGELAKTLGQLHSLCPSLQTLELCPEQSGVTKDATIPFLYKCKKLVGYRIVTTTPHPKEFILHLSQQESLRSVSLTFDEECASDLSFLTTHPTSRPTPFRALDTLSILIPALIQCTEFIRVLGTCKLRLVHIEYNEPSIASDIHDLFVAFRDHCAHYSLQTLRIEYLPFRGRRWPLDPELHALTRYILSPILEFPNMRNFTINVPLIGRLDDLDIRAIADAWPLLIDFTPIWRCGWMYKPSQITWAGVAYMAWRCRSITELSLGVNTTIQNVAETTELPGFQPNRSLRIFDLKDSVLCDPELCAQAIFAFSPLTAWVIGQGEEIPDEKGLLTPIKDYNEGYFNEVSDRVRTLFKISDGQVDQDSILASLAAQEAEELNPWGWHG